MKSKQSSKLCCYPINEWGRIIGYDDNDHKMPSKVLEMGLLPNTTFKILHQAPFRGPLYIEYGEERTKVALREEEAMFILVESMDNGQ